MYDTSYIELSFDLAGHQVVKTLGYFFAFYKYGSETPNFEKTHCVKKRGGLGWLTLLFTDKHFDGLASI